MKHYELRKLLVQNNIPFNETWDYFETPDMIIPKMGNKLKMLNTNTLAGYVFEYALPIYLATSVEERGELE